jgi:protein TonB
MAITVVIGFHAVAVLALLLPLAPAHRSLDADPGESIEVERVLRPAEAPPPPPRPAVASTAVPDTQPPAPPAALPTAPSVAVGQPAAPPEEAAPPLVVYSSMPAMQLETPDVPAAEIPVYRASFEASRPENLENVPIGAAATFKVLIDHEGRAAAFVPVHYSVTEITLERLMDRIGRWRFRPATKGGVPVSSWLEVSMQF